MRRQSSVLHRNLDKERRGIRLVGMLGKSVGLIKWSWLLVLAAVALLVLFAFYSDNNLQNAGSHPGQSAGISGKEILLGSSSALGGHASFLGTQYTHGAIAWFNEVNAAGGIHGRNIRLISNDDEYDPPKTVANTERLIHDDQVFMLFNFVDTPTSVKIIDTVHENKIPSFGFLTGAEALRTPFRQYMVHVRASYYSEETWEWKHRMTKGCRYFGKTRPCHELRYSIFWNSYEVT
jgi:branched-chain amino acid transport system substrate-binding protein